MFIEPNSDSDRYIYIYLEDDSFLSPQKEMNIFRYYMLRVFEVSI